MKKVVLLLAMIVVASLGLFAAPISGEKLMVQGKAAMDQKDYSLATSRYVQAYYTYLSDKNYVEAARAGMHASRAFTRAKNYDEAQRLLNRIDKNFADIEQSTGKPLIVPRFLLERGRLNLFIEARNEGGAVATLVKLKALADSAKDSEVDNDLLYAQARYYYAYGQPEQGDVCTSKLIRKFANEKDYRKAKADYQELIHRAVAGNNAHMVNQSYEGYIKWSDSIEALDVHNQMAKVKKQYDESLQTISDREDTIKAKTGMIIALGILLAVAAGVMIILCITLWRFIARNRKMHSAVADANERNAQKTMLIRNISSKMEPALSTLDQGHPAVKGIRRFTDHVRELSDLEATLDERYPLEDVNIQAFCDEMIENIRPMLKPGVNVVVNASKSMAKLNKEETGNVIMQLLKFAAEQTPEGGKITFDYKKRGAKLQQFIVTDTGEGIPEELKDTIFKAFATDNDLMQDDGLELPIAALRATKLEGSLRLDNSYRHGTRFILDLHS